MRARLRKLILLIRIYWIVTQGNETVNQKNSYIVYHRNDAGDLGIIARCKMMKLLTVLFIAVLLCGCQKSVEEQLVKLGYTKEESELIMNLEEADQNRFLDHRDEKMTKYLLMENFKAEKLDDYLKYDGLLADEKVVELVNEGIINDSNAELLKEMYDSEYFIEAKEKLYLQYLDRYDDLRKLLEFVNTKRYMSLYTDVRITDVSKDVKMLVNKYYRLPADYEPDDLVPVEAALGRGYLRKEVYEAYKKLYEDSLKEGFNLKIVSAYRSYATQQSLYNGYLKVDPKEVVDTYSARPGHSEHQTGLCMDVSEPGYSLDNFYQTKASKWLAANCYKYGFIIRYPEDKTDITGYQGEPWQLRYVGMDTAKDVYRRGITYDEYYACFVE